MPNTDTEEVETTETEETESAEIEATDENTDDEATLQTKWEAQRKVNRDLEAKLKDATKVARKRLESEYEQKLKDALASRDKPAEEQALDAARAEARTEATAKANERITRAEVKAAATGKVKNPALALKLIDTSGIDVDDDGEVDSDQVNQAIVDLLEQYPELAADGSKFTGSADQGAKGKSAKPAQMTQGEFDRIKSNPHAVMKAKEEGLLNTLLGIETT